MYDRSQKYNVYRPTFKNMKMLLALLHIPLLALSTSAAEPDPQQVLDRTMDRLSQSQVLSYSFRHQGPGAYALTTGWAKLVMPLGNMRGGFSQARIEGRTGTGEQVVVAIDRPDIYALDYEQKTLWHSTPKNGALALYNPEHLAPTFLLRGLSRAHREKQAKWVGRQVLGQTPCDVVDYYFERMDLRVWIGQDDALPRRIEAYSDALFGSGALIIALDDLQTHAPVYEGDFELDLTDGFKRAEYKGRDQTRWD